MLAVLADMIYQSVSRAASATADRRQRWSEQTTEPRQTASKDRVNHKQSRPEPQAKPVESCGKAGENIAESRTKGYCSQYTPRRGTSRLRIKRACKVHNLKGGLEKRQNPPRGRGPLIHSKPLQTFEILGVRNAYSHRMS